MRRTLLAAAFAAPLALTALLRPAKAWEPPDTPGVQPDGNIAGMGPESQVFAVGEHAAGFAAIVDNRTVTAPNDEGYWLVSGWTRDALGEPVNRKWISFSGTLLDGNHDDATFTGQWRLNAHGVDAQGQHRDDIVLRGYAHKGAAFFWPYGEYAAPGDHKLYVNGLLELEPFNGAAGINFLTDKPTQTSMAAIGPSSWQLGDGKDDLVIGAQAGRSIKIVVDGNPHKMLIFRDGDIYRPGDTVGLFARVAALGG